MPPRSRDRLTTMRKSESWPSSVSVRRFHVFVSSRCGAGMQARSEAAALAPDGRTVASGSSDGTVRLWSLGQDAPRLILSVSDKPVTGISFHPAGEWLAASSADGIVRIWRLDHGAAVQPPRNAVTSAAPINTVRFSPDGAWLCRCGRKGLFTSGAVRCTGARSAGTAPINGDAP